MKLVLLRHGESEWNLENRFTGWTDVDLSDNGRKEALSAGKALLDGGFFGALPTEEGLVTFCATERRTREEIDRMIDLIKQIQL